MASAMKVAVCIGNGSSRKDFDLTKIKDIGPNYGCNQLIEEFPLDNTIVVDRALLLELLSKGYHNKTNLYTREKWVRTIESNLKSLSTPDFLKLHRWDNEQHWGSGIHALNLAASHQPDLIIMLGYDIWPSKDSDKIVDPGCWIYQISRILSLYPHINFVQIQPKTWVCPDLLSERENLMIDDYEKLESCNIDLT